MEKWLFERIINLCAWFVPHLLKILELMLPPHVYDWLNTNVFATVSDSINTITYFIPIFTIFTIIGTTLGIVAKIRLYRWLAPRFLGGK